MRDAIERITTAKSTRLSRWQALLLRASLLLFLVPLLLPSPSFAQTASFGPATNYSVGGNPQSVAIGDLNGDGTLDLAVANQGSGTISILLGTVAGTFSPATSFPDPNPFFVAMGDLDRDGNLDLVVVHPGFNNVSVLLGAGTGAFGAEIGRAHV